MTSTTVQTLSLSMRTGSQSSTRLPVTTVNGESSTFDNDEQQLKNAPDSQTGATEAAPRKSIDTFGQRTSIYRGVKRHRWTGRYEAHLWDNSCRREGQTRKGRQVHLGGYDKEEKAARSYDLAALKYWGTSTTTNFPMSNYEKEIEEMKHMTRQEYVASLRRKSSGFSRGASIYRGVTRHHQHGRWQARIRSVAESKDLYLGTFSTQEEAAEAYDIAVIKFRGLNAVTNFEINRYDVKSILESSTLPIGGAAKRLKDAEMALDKQRSFDENPSSLFTDGLNSYSANHGWPAIAFQQAQPLSMHKSYPYRHLRRDTDVNQSFRDLHQLQLGNAQNFLQHSGLHNLMSLDSSSIEHSSGSNSIIYSNNAAGDRNGTKGNFFVPMGTALAQDEVKPHDYENMFGLGSGDPYLQERNSENIGF
ncbi:AP2-like ethylene-responsive transcription factor PLT2 isoform X1 [Olea europaea var. sylvestris]|uniref:AP2-like ethylene-responsive transcription factor PLT2 isoform X1 n=1 Tax=Olea europaea var. sylvestris TaxID=158386 RepID=UPI000C1D3194|nr:AP2-like ethylene-responsive transcription factor PLT2 isoform X1 [Olea europaea var. sylvestris]